jgi:hypothetical protein
MTTIIKKLPVFIALKLFVVNTSNELAYFSGSLPKGFVQSNSSKLGGAVVNLSVIISRLFSLSFML